MASFIGHLPGGREQASDAVEPRGGFARLLDLSARTMGVGLGITQREGHHLPIVAGVDRVAEERIQSQLEAVAGEVSAADLVELAVNREGRVLADRGLGRNRCAVAILGLRTVLATRVPPADLSGGVTTWCRPAV